LFLRLNYIEEKMKMNKELKIIGSSKNIKEAREKIKLYAPYEENVLIKGETGTGKNLASEKIHYLSPRKKYPFLKADCSCFTDTLIISELYGHRKGAFTGAIEEKEGLFLKANNGTLLLDGIESLSFNLQSSLLTAVEEKKIKRLGENFFREINVRVIATTNRDLEKLIKEGKFRKDLYFRLYILSIYLAPLRERKEDIMELADYQLYLLNREYKKKKNLAPEVESSLVTYSWPGNVRELNSIISYVYVHSKDIIYIEAFPEKIKNYNPEKKIIISNPHSISEILYHQMIKKGKSFWEVVHRPFLERELNRREVKEIIALGLKQTKGSYKKLLPLFNIGQGEKDYKRFMNMLRIHGLK
ncbi:MAG: sigma 54-interacting transcriptional regulator, partial [Methanosarcinales archaeon]